MGLRKPFKRMARTTGLEPAAFAVSIPGPVRAIAQTPDGYLWLATNTGLFRFDGIRFVLWDPSHLQAKRKRRARRWFLVAHRVQR